MPDRDDRLREVVRGERRDVDGHEPAGRLVQHALRRAVGGAADDAAGRIAGAEVGRGERRVAGPQGVVVVRPERRSAAGRHAPRGRRRSASRPIGRCPSRGPPATRRAGGPAWAAREARQAVVERLRVRQVDLALRDRGLGEMQVRVGQPGDRDLVGLEVDPLGERVGPGLEEDLGAGEGDATVADPDRLDPAEALVARRGSRCGR